MIPLAPALPAHACSSLPHYQIHRIGQLVLYSTFIVRKFLLPALCCIIVLSIRCNGSGNVSCVRQLTEMFPALLSIYPSQPVKLMIIRSLENGPPGPPGLHGIDDSEVRHEYSIRVGGIIGFCCVLFWSGCGPELDICAKIVPHWCCMIGDTLK